jgi:hypothetical protein
MLDSNLQPLTSPPLSFACTICDKTMKVVLIEPAGAINVAYVYRCSNGHQRELIWAAPR